MSNKKKKKIKCEKQKTENKTDKWNHLRRSVEQLILTHSHKLINKSATTHTNTCAKVHTCRMAINQQVVPHNFTKTNSYKCFCQNKRRKWAKLKIAEMNWLVKMWFYSEFMLAFPEYPRSTTYFGMPIQTV